MIQAGKFTIWIRLFELKNYNRVHQVYQFHQNKLVSSYNDVKVYEDKYIKKSKEPHLWTSSYLIIDKIASKTVHNEEQEGDR